MSADPFPAADSLFSAGVASTASAASENTADGIAADSSTTARANEDRAREDSDLASSTPAFRPSSVLWARVEDGFHVANADGVFLGYIDREADGSYLVFDGRSRRVGRAPDRRAAMDMLVAHQPAKAECAA